VVLGAKGLHLQLQRGNNLPVPAASKAWGTTPFHVPTTTTTPFFYFPHLKSLGPKLTLKKKLDPTLLLIQSL